MKNRAKCKLCDDILESFHEFDFVICRCGEISISGGQVKYECGAKDWSNFLRIGEDGQEIHVRVEGEAKPTRYEIQELDNKTQDEIQNALLKSSKTEIIKLVQEMIKTIESLPQHAKDSPITHTDYLWTLRLINALMTL